MRYPQWTDPQFLDADGVGGLNFAAQNVSGAVAEVGAAAWAAPGLVAPEAADISATLMVVSAFLPSPFGIVTTSGTVAQAHGTQTGQDTNAYAIDFAPLIPTGGPVTAYLAATIAQIQQDPFPIPGPPPGFPSFNPNFVPTIGYATNVQTIALSAVTGGIDNVNTFELMRTVLFAGMTTLATSGFTTAAQFRAPLREASPALVLASGGVLSPAQSNQTIIPGTGGLTFTVPPTAEVGGLLYSFANQTTGNMTIATSGADVIQGYGLANAASVNVFSEGALTLWTAGSGVWSVVSAGAVQVLRTNPGYIILPGGIIIQNGAVTIGANQSLSINYATPFLGGNTAFLSTVSINATGTVAAYIPTMNINSAGAGATNFVMNNPNAVPFSVTWTVWGL